MVNAPNENAPKNHVFFPQDTLVCSEPFSKFLLEFRSDVDFFFFITKVVDQVDRNRVTAAKALAEFTSDEIKKREYQKSADQTNFMMKQLQKHGGVLSRNLTNGIVNSFHRYFSAIIQAAAIKKPVIMASSQTIKVDDVLKFSRHKDLVSFIIDRKINPFIPFTHVQWILGCT